jgi:hypothetical protein
MRENRSCGSEGGVALTPPPLPPSKVAAQGLGACLNAGRMKREAYGVCRLLAAVDSHVSDNPSNAFVCSVSLCESGLIARRSPAFQQWEILLDGGARG